MENKKSQQRLFNQPNRNSKRSTFNLSYNNQMTANFNKFIPSYIEKTLPGDSFHIKTSYFTRWLSSSAPTFNRIDIKFNNFFIPNNLIWGGWEQFQGFGDNKSAEYLNPGTITDLTTLEIPHFTTRSAFRWYYKKLVTKTVGNVGEKEFLGLGLSNIAKKYYYLVVLPIVCEAYSAGKNQTATESAGEPIYTYNTTVKNCIMLVRKSSFWNDMFNRQYAYNLGDSERGGWLDLDLKAWFDIVAEKNIAFCYKNFNVNYYPEGYTIIDLPYNSYVLNYHFITSPLDETQKVGIRQYDYPESQLLSKSYTQFFQGFFELSFEDNVLQIHQNADIYYPSGSLWDYNLNDNEFAQVKLSVLDIWFRTFGQDLVAQVMGAGTLSDYFGKCYSQKLLRQPFTSANVILGNINRTDFTIKTGYDRLGIDKSFTAKYYGSPYGSYNEDSDTIEVGIVNDVPISFLPYLAYHKCWSDYLRDQRFEMQSHYSNPYKSPFLVPLNRYSGDYCHGNIFADDRFYYYDDKGYYLSGDGSANEINDPYYLYSDDNDYPYSEQLRREITSWSIVSLDSFFYLLTLRERRIVEDFLTLVNPTAQYGDSQFADVELSADGSLNLQRFDGGPISVSSSGASLKTYNSGNVFYTDTSDGNQRVSYNSGLLGKVSVTALRLATRMQRFLEESNLPSSDYVAQILTRWGVKVDHCNHCQVRYLGGDKFTPKMNPITMVGSSTESQATGQQTGMLTSSGSCGKVDFESNEHGFILQFVSIVNDFVTPDGFNKDEITYFDYPLQEFADLGPEGLPLLRVLNTDGTENSVGTVTNPMKIFGYVPRYATYKCRMNEIHGDFRKNLNYWITKRKFNPNLLNGSFGLGKVGNIPEIGKNFLYENPDYNSFDYNESDYDHCLMDIDQFVTCSRKLPMLPNPRVL